MEISAIGALIAPTFGDRAFTTWRRQVWMTIGSWLVAWLFTVNSLAQPPETMPVLRPHAGPAEFATAARLAPDGRWEFNIAGTWSPHDEGTFLSWGRVPELRRGGAVLLSAGSLLRCDHWRITGDTAGVTKTDGEEVVIPRARLRALIAVWPSSHLERDRQLNQWLATSRERDRVTLQSGDVLVGAVLGGQGTTDASGWLAAGDDEASRGEDRLRVELARGTTTIDSARVESIEFRDHPVVGARTASPTRWFVGLRDGSLLHVASVERRGNDILAMTLVEGIVWEVSASALEESLSFLQPSFQAKGVMVDMAAGKDEVEPRGRDESRNLPVYVSDLAASGYRHVPLLQRHWDYQRDANVLGGRLRSVGQIWLKGIGMHATSRLSFDLTGDFSRLVGDLTVDDAAAGEGSVVFRVYVDRGDGMWRSAFTSGIVRGGEPLVPLDVDIRGARRLALIVDAADRGDVRDYANWLSLRLYPEPARRAN